MSSTAIARTMLAFCLVGPGDGRDVVEAKEGWEEDRVDGEAGGDEGEGEGLLHSRRGWLE